MATRVTDLEQQLAQLRWRRMQNEREIRTSLEQTKILKQKDTMLRLTVDQSSERSMWMTSVLNDELSRPLVISDEELHHIQEDDAITMQKLTRSTQRHLDTVKKLKCSVEKRSCYYEEARVMKVEKLYKIDTMEKELKKRIADLGSSSPIVNVKCVPPRMY